MTVPSREEAARLLLSLDPPAWHLRHSRVVGEVAGWLARQISLAHPERPIDPTLVESAALLHDLDKALPKARRGAGVRHGEAGARWLREHGHAELAQAVSLHPVMLLVTDAGAATLAAAPLEARLVAYADKRGRQRVVSPSPSLPRPDRESARRDRDQCHSNPEHDRRISTVGRHDQEPGRNQGNTQKLGSDEWPKTHRDHLRNPRARNVLPMDRRRF